MQTVSFLKPEHVAPIRNLSLRARLIVEGMIAGLHKSPYHGFSAEFSEYRSYRTGESSRTIDWRKFAKTDRSYVRLYEDETNLYAHVLIDKSASMGFSADRRISKFDYARTLAASIAWILIRQRDAVSLAAFDERITTYLPPHATNLQLQNILSALDALQPGAQTSCGTSIDLLARGVKKRGMTVILSDFFDDPQSIIKGLRHLRFKRQDVLCLWILDPQECAFSDKRSYQLNDMETGRTLLLDGSTAAAYLQAGMRQHRDIVENGCRELKIDFCTIMTDEPFVRALMRVLSARGRM
jgi:uncharacterized protein (DUF58 family)